MVDPAVPNTCAIFTETILYTVQNAPSGLLSLENWILKISFLRESKYKNLDKSLDTNESIHAE